MTDMADMVQPGEPYELSGCMDVPSFVHALGSLASELERHFDAMQAQGVGVLWVLCGWFGLFRFSGLSTGKHVPSASPFGVTWLDLSTLLTVLTGLPTGSARNKQVDK